MPPVDGSQTLGRAGVGPRPRAVGKGARRGSGPVAPRLDEARNAAPHQRDLLAALRC
jgi:hypothetical protein